MKLSLSRFIYFAFICILLMVVIQIMRIGANLPQPRSLSGPEVDETKIAGAWISRKSTSHTLQVFILQLITVLISSRLFGWMAQKIGLPVVTGEIFAGIMLGPSLIGGAFPVIYKFLFPLSRCTI